MDDNIYITSDLEINRRIAAGVVSRGIPDSERSEVARLSRRLFPVGFELDFESTEEFRVLCLTSQVTLIRPTLISSHRKYLGPIIVFVKRLLWPVMQIYFKQTLTVLSEFNSRTVIQLARSHVRSMQQAKDSGR